MQPVPALVMAWRYTWSCTSPAANTPGHAGLRGETVEAAPGDDVAVVHLQLALEDFGVGRWPMAMKQPCSAMSFGAPSCVHV